MWKLFEKQKKPEAVVNITSEVITIEPQKENPVIISNYPPEVVAIHREFDVAAEDFLQQCKNIIETQPEVNKSKIEVLKNLGFKQVKEVTEGSEIISKVELSKEQIELVTYYQQHYPYNKFITEDQVKQICHKYNLVCGDVDRFRGFVPEKNMNEILNFKLKDKDQTVTGYVYGNYNAGYYSTIPISLWNSCKKRGAGNGDLNKDDNWTYASEVGLNGGEYFDRVTKTSLKICAPIKDMDIKGLNLKDGYKLEKIHIPDPVVLQPVKEGYLILTAWGDEASDPLVVNQNHN